MNYLLECNHALTAAVRAQFPDAHEKARFSPNLSLSHGDISSRICMALAARLRQPLDEIAAAVSVRLSIPHLMHDGFLNVNVPESELWAFDNNLVSSETFPELYEPGHEVVVVLLPPHREISGLAYLRLAAIAIWQVLLLKAIGRRAALKVLGEDLLRTPGESLTLEYVADLMQRGSDPRLVRKDGEIEAMLAELVASSHQREGREFSCWLSTRSLNRNAFRALVRRGEGPPIIRTQVLELDWFLPWSEEDLSLASTWGGGEVCPLLWYLLKPLPAAELDLSVPRLKENANTEHFLGAMHERLQMLCSQANPAGSRSEGQAKKRGDDYLPRELVVRYRFGEFFLRRAAIDGEVRALFAQLEHSLQLCNRYLNTPALRQRARAGTLGSDEFEFLTGLQRRLSDMMSCSDALDCVV